MPFDHLLLVGFGGPRCRDEVRPFLEQVTRGTRIPEERLRQVKSHYALSGGFSPYNQHALRLKEKLQQRLPGIPIFLGMRNWHPFLGEVLSQIHGKTHPKGLVIVLAPHRSPASFDRYLRSVMETVADLGRADLTYEALRPWYDHPLFIQAQVERVQEVWNPATSSRQEKTEFLFTAHSIPEEMARTCRYEEEILASSQAIAAGLRQTRWRVAYQSRSGDPRQPWLGPDIREMAEKLRESGIAQTVVIPIGFLFDHMEVLYDLDRDARGIFEQSGITFHRAPTVMDHPKFVEMLAQLVEEKHAQDR